jgi:hypothetical protein
MANAQETNSADFDRQKFAHEMLRKEIEYRRDKAWKIFSWASTILLGAIGGVVAIASKSELILPWFPHRTLLIVAIVVLSIYSCLWLRQNLNIEHSVSVKIKGYEVALGIRKEDEEYKKRPRFGYVVTLILLTLAALLSVLLVPLSLPRQQSAPQSNNSFNPTAR